VNHWHVDGDG